MSSPDGKFLVWLRKGLCAWRCCACRVLSCWGQVGCEGSFGKRLICAVCQEQGHAGPHGPQVQGNWNENGSPMYAPKAHRLSLYPGLMDEHQVMLS